MTTVEFLHSKGLKKWKNLQVTSDEHNKVIFLKELLEEYHEMKQKLLKHGVSGKRPDCNCISGSLLLHDLLQIANIKNEDGMSVVEYVNKPNGGSVAYIRHDAMVKKLNSIMAACASGAVDKTVSEGKYDTWKKGDELYGG